jgi:hypothetical protein
MNPDTSNHATLNCSNEFVSQSIMDRDNPSLGVARPVG